jgi:hypothetical protein
MAIVDFVPLYNKAAEALAKSDRVGFDFYSVFSDAKALLLKYCKPLLHFQIVLNHFAWLAGNIWSKIRASKRIFDLLITRIACDFCKLLL